MKIFKRYPIASLVAYATAVLAVLTFLQGAHILTGPVARWVDFAAGLLQVLLTAYARQHVTPIAAPKDASGRKLVPVSMRPGSAGIGVCCSHGYEFGANTGHHCGELPSDGRPCR